MIHFEYGRNKSQTNFIKHGIDFVEVQKLWSDHNLIKIPVRTQDESRFLIIAKIDNKHWSAVTTYRAQNIRINPSVDLAYKRLNFMKAKEFDEIFDAGDDVTPILDLSKAQHPFHDQKRSITIQSDTSFFENTNQDSSKIETFRASGWLKLLEPSLFNLGIISSLLGGLIFLIYFCNIRYFPELDSQSLLFFLAAITPLGFFLFLGLVVFLLMPGMIWIQFLDLDTSMYPLLSKYRIMILKNLVLEKINISEVLDSRYIFRKENYIFSRKKICMAYVYTFLAGPLLYFICILFLTRDVHTKKEILFKMFNFTLTTQAAQDMVFILLVLYFIVFTLAVLMIYRNLSKFSSNSKKKMILFKSIWMNIKLSGFSIFIFCLFFINWMVISFFFGHSTDGSNYSLTQEELLPIVFATFISCVFTNLFVVCRYPRKQLSFLLDFGIGSIVLVFLIVSLDKIMVIPGKIMNTYGWGNIDNASIIVDRTSCQAIESMNIKMERSCLEKDRTYKIEGVCILSSIGKNYYLRFPRCNLQKGDFRTTEIALVKTNVISWSRQNLKQGVSIKSN
jgi:uncharacterized protein